MMIVIKDIMTAEIASNRFVNVAMTVILVGGILDNMAMVVILKITHIRRALRYKSFNCCRVVVATAYQLLVFQSTIRSNSYIL